MLTLELYRLYQLHTADMQPRLHWHWKVEQDWVLKINDIQLRCQSVLREIGGGQDRKGEEK